MDSLEINAILHFHFLHINKKEWFFLLSFIDSIEEEKTPASSSSTSSKKKHTKTLIRCFSKHVYDWCSTKSVLHKNYIFRFIMFCNHIIKSIRRIYIRTALFHVFKGHTCVTHVYFDCIEMQINKQKNTLNESLNGTQARKMKKKLQICSGYS